MARPTKYNEQILIDTQKYIDECNDVYEVINKPRIDNDIAKDSQTVHFKVKIPTIEGLAFKLKVNKDTIYTWRKEHEEFSDLIEHLLAKQADVLINNGLSGDYNSVISKVLLTKHGYREGTDTDITSKGEKISTPFTDDVLKKGADEIKEKLLNGKNTTKTA